MATMAFDANYYLAQYQDVREAVAAGKITAEQHWKLYGCKEERNPNSEFNTAYYASHNPDVVASGMNYLDHYIKYGSAEAVAGKRLPNSSWESIDLTKFDKAAYLAANQDVKASGMDALQHYMLYGRFEASRDGTAKLIDGTVVTAPKVTTLGETFTLTTSVDNVVGTIGNDTIIAGPGSAGGVHTLGASDVINGGAGTDKIIITSAATAAEALVPRMSNVEQIFVQAVGTVGATLNLVNTTGAQQLWSDNSTQSIAVSNLQEKATIGVKGGVATSNYTVQAADAARTGDLAIALDSAVVNNLFVNSTGAAGGAGYTSTTINTATGTNAITGAAGTATSEIGTLDVGPTLATVKVTGDGAVRVVADLAATVRTIDASANKGGVNFNITNNTGNVTFTGGEGADRINFGGTLNLNDKVDGGAGRDILGVTNQVSIVTGLQVSNVEILELNTLNGTLEAARIAGVDEVRVTTNLADVSGVAIVNGLTSNSTFVTNDSGDVRLNITNAQVAGTNDTLNLKTGIAGVGSVNVMAAGVETVAYTQDNVATTGVGATTTVNFYDTDGVIDMTKLTIANNAGNTVNFNGLVNTIKTVDASAANGLVNVSVLAGNPTSGVSITGGAGNDILIGGDGKDIIVGGAGNDRIQGDANVGVAQVTQLSNFGTVEIGDTYSFTINGQTVSYTATAATQANVVAGLAAAVNGNAIIAASGVVASTPASGNLVLTGGATGAAFTVANVASTQAVATAEVDKLNVVGTADIGDQFTVTLDDGTATVYAWEKGYLVGAPYAATATNAQVKTDVINALNGDADFVAGGLSATLGVDGQIAITGPAAGTNVVVTAAETTAGAAQAQVYTLAGLVDAEVAVNDVFRLTINGVTKEFQATAATAANVLTGLANLVNSDPAINAAVTAAVSAGSLTITSDTAGVPFTSSITQNGGALSTGTDATTYAQTTANITVSTPIFTVTDDVVAGHAAGAVAQTLPTVNTTAGVLGGTASSDTLTGGAGNDTFVFVGQSGGWNGTALTNMDTITDLNLGGAVANVGVDTIQLSSAVLGYAAFGASSLVNAGTSVALTGPTFEAALQGLFNAGGALAGATNNVGLFTYGADTYLVAADSAAGLDANDIVIKVTGVTGTLDLSDITIV